MPGAEFIGSYTHPYAGAGALWGARQQVHQQQMDIENVRTQRMGVAAGMAGQQQQQKAQSYSQMMDLYDRLGQIPRGAAPNAMGFQMPQLQFGR